MDCRITVSYFLLLLVLVSALPSDPELRAKRDVMESMKNAWNEVVRTLSDAGDAVVNVFKPTTEKTFIDKMADGVKSLGQ